MARSEEQFKKIRDQRYEEISNAALKIFARKGFAGTKI
ncbi:TetR/AcrR family transcriptional regulator, partial [Virgibacillus halodenitrificans]|nr:TetR/AcrR family transcriptional regulator [Virgibacillus halodenitrificans]